MAHSCKYMHYFPFTKAQYTKPHSNLTSLYRSLGCRRQNANICTPNNLSISTSPPCSYSFSSTLMLFVVLSICECILFKTQFRFYSLYDSNSEIPSLHLKSFTSYRSYYSFSIQHIGKYNTLRQYTNISLSQSKYIHLFNPSTHVLIEETFQGTSSILGTELEAGDVRMNEILFIVEQTMGISIVGHKCYDRSINRRLPGWLGWQSI